MIMLQYSAFAIQCGGMNYDIFFAALANLKLLLEKYMIGQVFRQYCPVHSR